jgi:hypothetical protein
MEKNEIGFYKIDPLNNLNIYRINNENKKLLKPIALHDMILSKYATILGYYPMSQSKFNIFISFWQKRYEENKRELSKVYNMLLDMILEEINKRNNPKYLRKKKLQEIKNNLQN